MMETKEVYSNRVRAGRRVYFFDVKATKGGEYYLTITESKKNMDNETYTKHKLFLYKEDFEKFSTGLEDVISYVKSKQEVVERNYDAEHSTSQDSSATDESGSSDPMDDFLKI